MWQVWIREMSKTKPLLKRRELLNDVKTSGSFLRWDKFSGYLTTELDGIRRADGMNLILALIWNVRPCSSVVKGESLDMEMFESKSTDAGCRFGATHSSDEVRETRWSEGVASVSFIRWSTTCVGGTNG